MTPVCSDGISDSRKVTTPYVHGAFGQLPLAQFQQVPSPDFGCDVADFAGDGVGTLEIGGGFFGVRQVTDAPVQRGLQQSQIAKAINGLIPLLARKMLGPVVERVLQQNMLDSRRIGISAAIAAGGVLLQARQYIFG